MVVECWTILEGNEESQQTVVAGIDRIDGADDVTLEVEEAGVKQIKRIWTAECSGIEWAINTSSNDLPDWKEVAIHCPAKGFCS